MGCCFVIGFSGRPSTGKPAMTPTTGFLGRRDLRDRARDVVFEQALAVGRQHGYRRLLVEERYGEAEIELLAGVRQLAFDVVERGGILGIGIGLGIEALDDDFAVARCADTRASRSSTRCANVFRPTGTALLPCV